MIVINTGSADVCSDDIGYGNRCHKFMVTNCIGTDQKRNCREYN